MKLEHLRKLARDTRWQTLYTQSKDMNGIHLFDNTSDFSQLQIIFLQWLTIYNILETDLAKKEKYISRDVIEDDIRTDAYLLYRRLHKNSKDKKQKKKNKKRILDNNTNVPTIIFGRKKK